MSACKKTHWRFTENAYMNARGELVKTQRLRYLKRRSCEGSCQPDHHACDSHWIDEFISGYAAEHGELPALPKEVKHGDELVLKYSVFDNEVEEFWFEHVCS